MALRRWRCGMKGMGAHKGWPGEWHATDVAATPKAMICMKRIMAAMGSLYQLGRTLPTPAFSDASMKASRSPSSTFCVLLISTLVRRSLMRLLSST